MRVSCSRVYAAIANEQRRQIEESLARFLRTHHEDGTLQEDFITIPY